MNDPVTTSPPSRKLLVLDLDETLVHATEQALDVQADFQVGPYFVYRRPHLDEFIRRTSALFDIGIWTSSGEVYAAQVIERLFPADLLRFIWSSRRCTLARDPLTGEYSSVKNLHKLKKHGFNLESIIAVDDTPSKYGRHYGNLVRVSEFVGDAGDRLADYLDMLAHVGNVRSIEKRGWRKAMESRISQRQE